MNFEIYGLKNPTITDGVAVTTTPAILGTAAKRGVIKVANPGSVEVYLKYSKSATVAPTISATDWHEYVDTADNTPWLGVSESMYVWAWSASSTTVNVIEAGY